MTIFEIPLKPIQQTFDVVLSGLSYKMTTRWNEFDSVWMLDMALNSTGENLFLNMPLHSGQDLLSQHKYLEIPGELWLFADGADPFVDADEVTLGVSVRMFYTVDE